MNLPATVPDCWYGRINPPLPVCHLDLAKAVLSPLFTSRHLIAASVADRDTARQTTHTDMITASPHSRICVAFCYEAFPIHVSPPLMAYRNSFQLVDATDLPNAMLQRPFRPVPLNGLAQPMFGHWSVRKLIRQPMYRRGSSRASCRRLFRCSSAQRQTTCQLAQAKASEFLFIHFSAPAAMLV
ncbi:hypothetical protein LY78DRAFT_97208 [Colletotrichum sublineola]|nr:hypothetical protein LY78DRAFT_97208 [Colletotrichum sublineola]